MPMRVTASDLARRHSRVAGLRYVMGARRVLQALRARAWCDEDTDLFAGPSQDVRVPCEHGRTLIHQLWKRGFYVEEIQTPGDDGSSVLRIYWGGSTP